MTVEESKKAEWLRRNGFPVVIVALEDGWQASIDGEGRRYSSTIGNAIAQVYEWVTNK